MPLSYLSASRPSYPSMLLVQQTVCHQKQQNVEDSCLRTGRIRIPRTPKTRRKVQSNGSDSSWLWIDWLLDERCGDIKNQSLVVPLIRLCVCWTLRRVLGVLGIPRTPKTRRKVQQTQSRIRGTTKDWFLISPHLSSSNQSIHSQELSEPLDWTLRRVLGVLGILMRPVLRHESSTFCCF